VLLTEKGNFGADFFRGALDFSESLMERGAGKSKIWNSQRIAARTRAPYRGREGPRNCEDTAELHGHRIHSPRRASGDQLAVVSGVICEYAT
jgi:hypothetical protein